MKYLSKSPAETKKLAAFLRKRVFKDNYGNKSGATVIALQGELGSGKTVFAQGFLQGIAKRKIQSPTFVIWRRFSAPVKKSRKFRNIFHIDAYRLRHFKDAQSLRFTEMFNNPSNAILIEWPERIAKILPKKIILVSFAHKNKSERIINIRQIFTSALFRA